jgi:hypothetical protein
VGLHVRPENAWRKVDKGPPAEDAAAYGSLPAPPLAKPPRRPRPRPLGSIGGGADAAGRGVCSGKAFRDFWGDRSELRRFKDGSITETVVWTQVRRPDLPQQCARAAVHAAPAAAAAACCLLLLPQPPAEGLTRAWQGDSGPSRFAISGAVAEFALRRHLPPSLARAAPCGAGLTPLLQGKLDGAYGPAGEGPPGGKDAFQALEGLTKFLVGLDADVLPIRVMSVQPTSAALRGLGAAPLAPHPLAFREPELRRAAKAARRADGKKAAGRVCLCAQALDCIVNLQVGQRALAQPGEPGGWRGVGACAERGAGRRTPASGPRTWRRCGRCARRSTCAWPRR